ncbi:MAG: class I SAM-dependent methyltransferase [Acidobacteria bacterium]|nr:MAG: class I SAM-dependent methyltransferase [Acidobacteriota bacterium]
MVLNWRFTEQQIPRAAGRIDQAQIKDGTLSIAGWMLLPSRLCSPPSLFINGTLFARTEQRQRPDVHEAHPWIDHAGLSGFAYSGSAEGIASCESFTIELVLFEDSFPCGYLATLVKTESIPPKKEEHPPLELIRQIGAPDVESFEAQGLKVLTDFVQAIQLSRGLPNTRRVLDWGCGCGRVSSPFSVFFPDVELFGSDIAENCVDWCRIHLHSSRFVKSALFPPLPFADSSFDVVLASSVMTHLKRTVQLVWLQEMNRVLGPGGLLLASVLGDYAFKREQAVKPEARSRLYNDCNSLVARTLLAFRGICDRTPNEGLAGKIPAGYYMNVFQTEKYTRAAWSQHFEVLRYIERGMDNYQDLVVLRKP